MRRRSAAILERGDPAVVTFMLRLSRLFAPLHRVLGVDSELLEVLLRTKLILEKRQKRGEVSIGFVKDAGMALMLVLYMVMGLALGAIAFTDADIRIFINICGTMSLGMLMMPLMVDFAPILLDTSDVKMLSPLPVDDRTVLALRVTHIGVYLLALLACLAIGPVIFGSIAFNPLVLLPTLLLTLLQAGALGLACVLVFYLVALKTLDLSRFRDAMVYIQVGGFAAFYFASQVGPHIASRSKFVEGLIGREEVLLFWPPAAGGSLARLLTGAGEPIDIAIAATGWGVTIGFVAWAAWLARGGFIARLAEIETSGGKQRRHAPRHGLSGRLVSRIPSGPLERAGWTFFLSLTSADRSFKLRTMPMLSIVVMPFFLLFIMDRDFSVEQVIGLLPYAPYVLLFIVPSFWDASRFSETWEARSVFDLLSDDERVELVRGARRAAIVRYLAIPLVLTVLIASLVCSSQVLPSIALSAEVALIAAIWVLGWYDHEPFTQKFSQSNVRSNLALGFMATLLIAILGLGHFALSFVPYAVPVAALLLAPCSVWMWRTLPVRPRKKRRRKRGRAVRRPA